MNRTGGAGEAHPAPPSFLGTKFPRPQSVSLSVRHKEDAMRAFRENFVPVALLSLWVLAAGYTIQSFDGLRALRTVHATIDMTVTAPAPKAARASCPYAQHAATPI